MTKTSRWTPSEMPKEEPRGLVFGEHGANSSEISK